MASMITEKTVQNIIGRRNKEIHKGDCGRIMIAAGSEGMAGAAILAARSALRAGSGLVRTAIPKCLFPIVQVGVPEATCMERRLPIQNLADFDAVCAGPGLGEGKESIDFVKELLISYEITLIVDADGLNKSRTAAFSSCSDAVRTFTRNRRYLRRIWEKHDACSKQRIRLARRHRPPRKFQRLPVPALQPQRRHADASRPLWFGKHVR